MKQTLPDHLQKDLKVIFVGFNPSLRSAETGHHYANPSNRFWEILFQAGLTPRKLTAKEDGQLLNFNYGLTNIVDRPTKSADEITKEEYEIGRKNLREKIVLFKPKITCFVGKGVYLKYSGKRVATWGLQPENIVPGVVDFIAPSSSGLVRMRKEEIVSIYRDLKNLLEELDSYENV